MSKNTNVVSVVDSEIPAFEFNRFHGSGDIFINNKPTGPVQNHAILFEDTFDMMQQKFKEQYLDDMDLGIATEDVYCPYIKTMHVSRANGRLVINVESDVSNAIEILRNDTFGMEFKGDVISNDGNITIGDKAFSIEEAFQKHAKLEYYGVKRVKGEDYHIYKISAVKKMSDEVRDAYVEQFERYSENATASLGLDYNEIKSEIEEKYTGSMSTGPIELPEIPSGRPIYIANINNKLMVSADGVSFMNAPLGGDGVEISSTIKVSDKTKFLSLLRGLVNAGANVVTLPLYHGDKHDTNDLFSVSVKTIMVDYDNAIETGVVHVVAHLVVDDGQIVLHDNPDIIIGAGDKFVVEKDVEVNGFTSFDAENIKLFINMSVEYYRQIPKASIAFDTAQEMLVHDNTYLVKMGLPISIRVPRTGSVFEDMTEAQASGISGWFDFTVEEGQ
jgi:hypothetical protein